MLASMLISGESMLAHWGCGKQILYIYVVQVSSLAVWCFHVKGWWEGLVCVFGEAPLVTVLHRQPTFLKLLGYHTQCSGNGTSALLLGELPFLL